MELFTVQFTSLLLYFLQLITVVSSLPQIIRVGGLFERRDGDKAEKAFRYAIERFNNDRKIPGTSMIGEIRRIDKYDSFQAVSQVCRLLEKGVAAVFGPQTFELSQPVGSVLDSFDVPHFEARLDPRRRTKEYTFNLYPDWQTIVTAFKDLIDAKEWKRFAILYEENEGLVRMQWLLQTTTTKEKKRNIILRKLQQPYRDVLRELKQYRVDNILVDCKTRNLREFFKQAQQVGLMNDHNSYIITNLDSHTVNMDDFKHSQTNLTSFRLIDSNNMMARRVQSDLRRLDHRRRNRKIAVDTYTALMLDAVSVLADAVKRTDLIKEVSFNPISCQSERSWSSGNLFNELLMTNLSGLSGNVNFDHKGVRSNIKLFIEELTPNGLMKAGQWSTHEGLVFDRQDQMTLEEAARALRNKTLKITTILNKPYTMEKESSTKLIGNDRFEGYCIDVIDAISRILKFKYEIHINEDRKPGTMDKVTKKWDGMMGELLNGKADLAMGDLTITYEREEAVDFTMPFMNLGISILFRKPKESQPSLLSFLSPLSWRVWIYMLMAYAGVSVFMFFVARFSPYEWVSPHPCNQESDILENQFSLMNSLWFTIGSLMQQGSDIAPTAWSTRMVAGTWWFFTLIMISSYTANLAAFLTVQRMVSPIESAEDLVKQNRIKYGCYSAGSTENFFKNSHMETYKRMGEFMEANPSVMVSSLSEGVGRVMAGDYAYLMESTSIEYVIQRNCELTQIGGLLDSKGYGIATAPGSPYRQLISSAILKLQEETVLDVMKIKWWNQKRGGGRCIQEDGSQGSTGTALTLAHVGGVFVVLLGGIACSWIVVVFEFVIKTRSTARRGSLCSAMLDELRFALSCESSTRQVPKNDSSASAARHDILPPPYNGGMKDSIS
ncbi:Uncharacterised protein g4013 [Pycnogonum litorale]